MDVVEYWLWMTNFHNVMCIQMALPGLVRRVYLHDVSAIHVCVDTANQDE